jgi:hypothetical protein
MRSIACRGDNWLSPAAQLGEENFAFFARPVLRTPTFRTVSRKTAALRQCRSRWSRGNCYFSAISDVPRIAMCDEDVENTLSRVEEIIAAKGGPQFAIYYYGGEPFAAFERLPPIVVRARDRGIHCRYGIVANGCTATSEQIRWCPQNGLTAQPTIDGCAEE